MPHDITPSETIAGNVRAELARANKSGRQLAAEMGWHYPHLARRLSGDVAFRADELGRLAQHLGVPIEVLFRMQTERAS